MQQKVYDVAIVGAGAAGLMAAIQAAHEKLSVILIDRREIFGAKIIMSGGTRCNLTHKIVEHTDFATHHPFFVRSILKAFTPTQTLSFFQDIGVEVELEDTGKYFPTTHSGKSVLEALTQEAKKQSVEIKIPVCITEIKKENAVFQLVGENIQIDARTIILTTGGLSFPTTGSTGIGYDIATSFGHSLAPTFPSLTPLKTDDTDFHQLSGLTLPVELSLYEDNKKAQCFIDSFLFTHVGYSGPAVLNLSRYWIEESNTSKKITANFYPESSPKKLRKQLQDDKEGAKQQFSTYLNGFLPTRLVQTLLKKSNISQGLEMSQLKKEQRETFLKNLFEMDLSVSGFLGYEKAEVTAGGVSLAEIQKQDMQSKLVPGLFFAGEILDVDGRIGGFNFQWAWSSATVAARGAEKFLK